MERWIENHTRSSRVFPSGAQGTHGGCSGPCKTKWVKRILGSNFKNHHRHKANIFTTYTTLVKRQMKDTMLISALCQMIYKSFKVICSVIQPNLSLTLSSWIILPVSFRAVELAGVTRLRLKSGWSVSLLLPQCDRYMQQIVWCSTQMQHRQSQMVPLKLHIRLPVFDLVQSNTSQPDTRRTKTPMWHSLRLQTVSSTSKITTSIYIWWGVEHGRTCKQWLVDEFEKYNTILVYDVCAECMWKSSIQAQQCLGPASGQYSEHEEFHASQVHVSTSSVWVCSLQAGRACGNAGCTCTTSQQAFMNVVTCSKDQD